MTQVEFRHLRHALVLAEERNFARAAETLHVSQPALTRSIQVLEKRLGGRLFDRGSREVVPTMLGQLVLEHARGLDLSMRDLERDVALAKGLEVGELRIGAGSYGPSVLVAGAVARLVRDHPRLRTHVVVAPWEEIPERLHRREVDVMVGEVGAIESVDGLQVTPLTSHRLVTVCRPGHPLLARKKVTLADVLEFPQAGPQIPQRQLQRIVDRLPPGHRKGLPPGWSPMTFTCDNISVVLAVLQGSEAVASVLPTMVEQELADRRLVPLTGFDPDLSVRYGVAWLSHRTLSAPARRFVDLMVAHDQQLAEREDEVLSALVPPIVSRGSRPG